MKNFINLRADTQNEKTENEKKLKEKIKNNMFLKA